MDRIPRPVPTRRDGGTARWRACGRRFRTPLDAAAENRESHAGSGGAASLSTRYLTPIAFGTLAGAGDTRVDAAHFVAQPGGGPVVVIDGLVEAREQHPRDDRLRIPRERFDIVGAALVVIAAGDFHRSEVGVPAGP